MPDLIAQSILYPVLIGRDTQVAALARLWDQHIVVTVPSPCAMASNDESIGYRQLCTLVAVRCRADRRLQQAG
jgi:hypothetical protein